MNGKLRNILRIALLLFATGSIGLIAYIVILNIPPTSMVIKNSYPAASAIQETTVPVARQTIGKPVKLIIPALGIEANIQEVGVTPAGTMANPQGINKFRETGWYKNGARPGQPGSAVIDGHLDNALGLKGIFYNLNQLAPGDAVIVETDASEQLLFKVSSNETYDYKNAPVEKIFNTDDGTSLLNLITCDGTWVAAEKSYDKRLVVYTALVSISDAAEPVAVLPLPERLSP